ncbi:hypothetical protein CEXT_447711 [Caerostris extrusa]|uniref:RNase H type-1 domain-containing protein n=1 Tax=Caerostris extrusa TaxID=172846 RepID=A0AAV4US33_CAEEX|nr:hypothetical protein CEXT_447711 [Caerostris extrusa]
MEKRLPGPRKAIAYTDGSSDKFLNKGGAGIFLLLPNGSKYHHKMNTGLIASNFTGELIAVKEAVTLYLNDSNISGLTDRQLTVLRTVVNTGLLCRVTTSTKPSAHDERSLTLFKDPLFAHLVNHSQLKHSRSVVLRSVFFQKDQETVNASTDLLRHKSAPLRRSELSLLGDNGSQYSMAD